MIKLDKGKIIDTPELQQPVEEVLIAEDPNPKHIQDPPTTKEPT